MSRKADRIKARVILSACCENCRHEEKDERAAYRHYRQKKQGAPPPLFCSEKGFREGVCEKFLPRKADVINAIWKAKNKESEGDDG